MKKYELNMISLESKIKELNDKLYEFYKNRNPKTPAMPEEYYKSLKEKQALEKELRSLIWEQNRLRCEVNGKKSACKKVFVNSFGEAATREITNSTYKSACKRLEKDVFHNLGY